jgi:hypothetical protein
MNFEEFEKSTKVELANGAILCIPQSAARKVLEKHFLSFEKSTSTKSHGKKFHKVLGNKPWTETETETLRKEFNHGSPGASSRRLANVLHRTPMAIRNRATKLKL